ncbi:MAG: SPOR domain-containing protein, partial [Holosporales bacterium]|nr:SPOR domain-containing protein [Holosporales bacterium]
ASILSLVCITWIAYNWNGGHRQAGSVDGPVIIEPEQASFKVLPDQPGGLEIEHKDKTVYDRLHPGAPSDFSLEERLLPPQEDPIELTNRDSALTKPTNGAYSSGIEEYSIVDDKIYYIKFSAGKNKHILESEAKLMKKKYGQLIGDVKCEVKKVSNAQGEQKHAILIGPFDSQDAALDMARHLGGQCYIVSVKEQ